MNSNIKPTFLTFIAGLEQSDLVELLTEMVGDGMVTARNLQHILKHNKIEIPADKVNVIVGHNIKKISVTYCSNFNGASIDVLETVDGTPVEEYTETEAYRAVEDQLINAVVEHAGDECGEEGTYYGSIECLGEDVIEIVHGLLGNLCEEVSFDEDSTSS